MPVPYTFANQPASQGLPLAWLDADFAYLSAKSQIKMEALTISVINTIPALSETYSGNMFLLIVNGMTFVPVGSPAPFSVSGKTITWTSTVWAVSPGDTVVAVYSYTG